MRIHVTSRNWIKQNFSKLKKTSSNVWSLPGKVRLVCNASSQLAWHFMNENLLIGPDSVQNLIGIIFRFQEKHFPTSAGIETMCFQVKVPAECAECLRFIWRENQADYLSIYENTRQKFGAKDSPTCANYALKRTAQTQKNNSRLLPKLLNAIFIWTTSCTLQRNPRSWILEANLISLLQKGGFKLSKGQSNVKELCEEDSDVEIVIALGLVWNLRSDDLELCRSFAD